MNIQMQKHHNCHMKHQQNNNNNNNNSNGNGRIFSSLFKRKSQSNCNAHNKYTIMDNTLQNRMYCRRPPPTIPPPPIPIPDQTQSIHQNQNNNCCITSISNVNMKNNTFQINHSNNNMYYNNTNNNICYNNNPIIKSYNGSFNDHGTYCTSQCVNNNNLYVPVMDTNNNSYDGCLYAPY